MIKRVRSIFFFSKLEVKIESFTRLHLEKTYKKKNSTNTNRYREAIECSYNMFIKKLHIAFKYYLLYRGHLVDRLMGT